MRFLHPKLILLPALLFSLTTLGAGEPVAHCPELYARFASQFSSALSARQEEFLQKQFYPVVGKRAWSTPPLAPRDCLKASDSCLVFPNAGAKDIRIEWIRSPAQKPWVEVTETSRILKIPRDTQFTALPDQGRPLVQQLLVGSDLHPFVATPEIQAQRVALGERPLFLKQSQEEAIESLKAADAAGERKLLLISPTGWGKTEVLKPLFAQRLEKGGKLHLVVADQNALALQLEREMENLQKDTPFRLRRWGDGNKAGKVADLIQEANSSDEPLVLVTTIQSLKRSLKKTGWEDGIQQLKPHLSTFVYDEAHHTGAPEAQALIEGLIDAPDARASLIGITATPVHARVGIQEFFSKAHWAYLEDGPAVRELDAVVTQLSQAIQRGELTPFNNTYFITPQSLGVEANTLFTPNPAGHYVLDSRHYDSLFRRMQPLFAHHQHGFLTVGSIDEANRLADYLNQVTPNKRFAVLHSRLTKEERDEVQKLYREGHINYLITVRYLDEGVRYPGMSLYVDLNRNVGARPFLQRIGRVLALEPNKDHVDIVSLMELDQETIKEHLELIDQTLAGKLSLPRGPSQAGQQSKPVPEGNFAEPKAFSLNREEMEAELRKVRAQLQSFWNPQLNPAQRAAEITVKHILQHGQVPRSGKESATYVRYLKFRGDPDFQAKVKESPEAWTIFEKAYAQALRKMDSSPPELAAVETIEYIRKHGSVPRSKNDLSLWERYRKYMTNDSFVAKIKQDPAAWKVFTQDQARRLQTVELSLAERAAMDSIDYILAHGAIPSAGFDNALYLRYRKHRTDAEFVAKIKENAQAWAIFEKAYQKALTEAEFTAPERAAMDTAAYIGKHGALPENSIDRSLYLRFRSYQSNPAFQAKLKENAEAWKIFEVSLKKRLTHRGVGVGAQTI